MLKGDLVIGADGERVSVVSKTLPSSTNILYQQSVVKAAYGKPDTLRQAIFKMFRIIVPIEKIIEDETTRPLLSLTRNKFTMFSDET
jgi:hypothetical protein